MRDTTPPGDQTAGPAAAPAVLADRYERRRLLGAGGMGQVYQGHDRALDRPVALKLLRPQFAADPVFVARFLREATAAARLSHPNVVAVYDDDEDVFEKETDALRVFEFSSSVSPSAPV